MKRLPALGRWGIYVGIAIVFAIACAFLSQWQFGRNADRSAELALVSENYDAPPVPIATLVPTPGAFDESTAKWHPVILTGHYLPDQQLLARNRPHGGTVAFEVLVPFQLDDGRVLLIDRGWVPPGAGDGPDSVPTPPTGAATVIGRLLPGESLPVSGRETAPDGQVPTINLPLIAERLGTEGSQLDQSTYIVMMSEDPAPATAPSSLEAPTNDPGPFLSYAIQWILFAVMGFVFIGYVIRTEVHKRREDAAEAAARAANPELFEGDAAPVRVARRRSLFGRRPDRDASDEDALLDRAGR
ncbi:SURF1 family protein [Microbacterium sp. X-17]|uniref:SURF1 family cytochrome oxidase biogenesis protein n=1 Tax=Microbacterium sp. X-17 TaxID=3144404 RepID=UPI0031F581E7